MLINWIRTLYSDNGTLIDKSLDAQFGGFSAALVASEDYIYIGQSFPFNSVYFKVGVANTTTAALSIQYWASTEWVNAVDTLDGTSTAGKTLAKSGAYSWTPNVDKAFSRVVKTTDSNAPVELNGVNIYDMYWVRISTNVSLSLTTSIAAITYCFSDDSVITALDPDINEYLTSWTSGKTSWIDQIVVASNNIILDLKGKGLISNPAQILKFDELYLAAAYKTLAIIYNGLGDKFIQKRDYANASYNAIINSIGITVDRNGNAIPDISEQSTRKGYLVR